MSFFSKIVENKGLVIAGTAALALVGLGMYSSSHADCIRDTKTRTKDYSSRGIQKLLI